MATEKESRLIEFANFVLLILTESKDWDGDTFDQISHQATRLGLATTDRNGYFKRTKDKK